MARSGAFNLMKNKMDIFNNRYTLFCIVAILMKQLIVASSTFWIANLASAVAAGQPFMRYLVFFIASLIVIYVPEILSRIFLEKAQYVSILEQNEKFIAHHQGNLALIYDKTIERVYKPWFTHETNHIIQEAFSVNYEILSTLLNVSFNIFALGMVIHHDIFFFYGIAFIFLLLGYKFSRKKIGLAGKQFQISRNHYNHCLIQGWDNLASGNSINKKLWKTRFFLDLENLKWAAIKQRWLTSGYSSVVMLAGLIPILLGLAFILRDAKTSVVLAAAIVATLPRQIQIIQFSHELLSMLFDYEAVRARIKQYIKMQSSPIEANEILKKRIKIQKIQINGKSFHSIDEALQFMHRSKTERLTIRGENGAGKSSLLALLKIQEGAAALILPAKTSLLFDENESQEQGWSSGEYIKNAFSAIERESTLAFILLDEWDANLDSQNLRDLSKLIDIWATKKVIVEIRH